MVNSTVYKKILVTAAREGGAVLHKYFRTAFTVTLKNGIHDIVTLADHEGQNSIVSSIIKSVKSTPLEGKIGFIGEEGLFSPGEYTFIIDPLDGTTNYAASVDRYCVSIGLMHDKKIIAGVVYDVMRKTFYFSQKGESAYENSKKLAIPTGVELSRSVLLSGFPHVSAERLLLLDVFSKSYDYVQTIRVLGSTVLDICDVAAGRCNLVMRAGKLWDLAAASIILEQAGGVILDWQGKRFDFDPKDPEKRYKFIAGEDQLVREFLHKVHSGKNPDLLK